MNDIQGMPPGGWTDVFELTITHATSERVSANWTVDPRLHGLFGTLHGGSHSRVAESLASIGASQWFGTRDAADQIVARSQVRLANLTPRTSSTAKVTDARR